MDWNDTIIVTMLKDKARMVVPRSVIRGLTSAKKRDYTADKDIEHTVLTVEAEWAHSAGFDLKWTSSKETTIALELDMDIKVVLGMLRGDKAAEVLYGN